MKNRRFSAILFTLMICLPVLAFAQEQGKVYGSVKDVFGQAIDNANVSVEGIPGGTITDRYGFFSINVPAGRRILLLISFVGFQTERVPLSLNPGEERQINPILHQSTTELPDFEVTDRRLRKTSLTRIDPKVASVIPSVGGGIEAILKTLPGVASNNELSSQYSVRGGNFDENLVYVNDIEIYRPFLVRSGQQEGLSFVNPDLVSSVLFSAGGFEAKYGDKMSSVLDIQYKRPQAFGGSASVSLLGASLHLEGASANSKLRYLAGVRQKSNQYLLGRLETSGEYKPSFTDLQTYISWDFKDKWELSFLGNYARNSYMLIPESRETDFGTVNQAYRFTVYFEGQEVDRYDSWMGALALNWFPRKGLKLRLISSAYRSEERETYDILGQYWIGRLETDFGKDEFGNVTDPIGVGAFLNHARNYLVAEVINIEQRGSWERENSYFQWGIKVQREVIRDVMHEWQMLDSAGYNLPHPPDYLGDSTSPPDLVLQYFVQQRIAMSTHRSSSFVQNTWNLSRNGYESSLTAGIRAQYWDFNKQVLISPRATLSFRPNWEKDFLFRISAGYYHQPAFYREIRNPEGLINPDIKAQTSFHLVGSADRDFIAWGRPFKWVAEIYYKFLDNLIPYEVDNVRIRYDAQNHAKGYATGIDLRVNGEFVRGIESWASLSVMETKEDIIDDFYLTAEGVKVYPGYIPRPTDQRVNFGLFFQDYLPKNPTFKMHLNLLYGSRLPFGVPGAPKYTHTFRIPPYRRVDIGFSKQLREEGKTRSEKKILHRLQDVWITLEVFNLLQVDNTISYIWVADISNRMYAIPNYLSPRMLNVKLVAKF